MVCAHAIAHKINSANFLWSKMLKLQTSHSFIIFYFLFFVCTRINFTLRNGSMKNMRTQRKMAHRNYLMLMTPLLTLTFVCRKKKKKILRFGADIDWKYEFLSNSLILLFISEAGKRIGCVTLFSKSSTKFNAVLDFEPPTIRQVIFGYNNNDWRICFFFLAIIEKIKMRRNLGISVPRQCKKAAIDDTSDPDQFR